MKAQNTATANTSTVERGLIEALLLDDPWKGATHFFNAASHDLGANYISLWREFETPDAIYYQPIFPAIGEPLASGSAKLPRAMQSAESLLPGKVRLEILKQGTCEASLRIGRQSILFFDGIPDPAFFKKWIRITQPAIEAFLKYFFSKVIFDETEIIQKPYFSIFSKYSELLTRIEHGALIKDMGGHIVFSNDAAKKLLGYPNEPICLRSLCVPESMPRYLEMIDRLRKGEMVIDMALDFIMPDGKTKSLSFNASPVGMGSRLEGYFIIFRDISKRKKIESQFELTKIFLKNILENLPVGIIALDAAGKLLYVNEYTLNLFKLEYDPETGKFDRTKFDYFQYFTDPQKAKEDVEILLREQKTVFNQILHLKNAKIVSRDFIPFFDDDGKFLGRMWVFRDITWAVSRFGLGGDLDNLLTTEEQQIIPAAEWNMKGKLVRANAVFEELIGTPATRGKLHLGSIFGQKKAQQLIDSDGSKLWELPLQTDVNNRRWCLVQASPIYSHDGKKTGILTLLIDITERKHKEQLLDLARKEAEQKRQLDRLFLATMSHEVRTPLNNIIQLTDLLATAHDPDTHHEYIEMLRGASTYLLQLINNILDLAKLEAGQLELELVEFDLKKICSQLVDTFRLQLHNKPVELILRFDESIDQTVIGDPSRLYQVLSNLLSNACKFTHVGAIILEVKALHAASEPQLIEFSVHDSGIGIEPEHQKTIFDRFRQAHTHPAENQGGTGLGLAIVKELVELMGGQIELKSKPRVGSTFSFALPLKLSGHPAGQDSGSEIQSCPEKNWPHLHMLLVDDNPINLKLLDQLLKPAKCRTTLATNGLMAFSLAQRQRFDIILMDLRMPGIDGCETTRRIRTSPLSKNRDTPIIAVSASILPEERQRALQSGMNDFLHKPFTCRELFPLIDKYKPQNPLPPVPPGSRGPSSTSFETAGLDSCTANLSILKQISQGDPSFVKTIVEDFCLEGASALEKLSDALSSKDWKTIQSLTHRLKPNLEIMGLPDLARRAEELETILQKGMDKFPEAELVRSCQSFCDRLRQALEILRENSLKEVP